MNIDRLEFKNEVTDMDRGKDLIMTVASIIETAKSCSTFEEYSAKLNEDKMGRIEYGAGMPKYTTMDYFIDIEVYNFLAALNINPMQQAHQLDM